MKFLAELIAEINGYLEMYPLGGNLHIVLEDDNWERCHIEYCRDNATEYDGWRLAVMLLALTPEELLAVANKDKEIFTEGLVFHIVDGEVVLKEEAK